MGRTRLGRSASSSVTLACEAAATPSVPVVGRQALKSCSPDPCRKRRRPRGVRRRGAGSEVSRRAAPDKGWARGKRGSGGVSSPKPLFSRPLSCLRCRRPAPVRTDGRRGGRRRACRCCHMMPSGVLRRNDEEPGEEMGTRSHRGKWGRVAVALLELGMRTVCILLAPRRVACCP